MGFTANYNLKSNEQEILRDQQHAARLFNADQFRLAPKQKFLFHVAFGINSAALLDTTLVQRHGTEINMLVKSLDLPAYEVKTEMLNQYNRKKVVQYQYEPREIGVKFHDDNMGLINHLWQNYYSYYYADPQAAKTFGSYNRNATKSYDYIQTKYGLDNGSTDPFFTYIKIFQMARHEYVCYTLFNPLITSWNHNRLDYSQGNQTHEFDMRLKYEAVKYTVGSILDELPEGFGNEHYDNMPSPLSGVNPDPTVVDPSFVQSLDIEIAAPNILSTVLSQISTYQNTKTALGTAPGNTVNSQSISGVQGISFPLTTSVPAGTIATQNGG